MIRLFHVSDVHFGAEDQAALDWFAAAVDAEQPDAIVMTGDLTMRARSREFEAAAEWLGSFGRPLTVEAGNHDLPYHNPLRRLFRPYRRYRKVERAIERPLEIEGVAVVPLKTTARFQWRLNWSKGYVSRRRLDRALETIEKMQDRDDVVLVACHHPLIEPGTQATSRTRGGRSALESLADAGVHAVLSGHVHDPYDRMHRVGGRTVRLIGAGTLSQRTREAPASFNEIIVDGRRIEVSPRMMG
ncbi:metallophosphoesterase family protein [Stakelama saccharophila]|uniref:Metallophosphoesterase n=1 Tax=Stakelama saccharophila TaxID=3075605 RepID=A0ABZ0BAA3_9SPHN|nr:metallophosphoesterase [Stakelama sp. W311]WNO53244.1 metallophosphoesterase [Stakelama sp. W311]